MMAMVASKVMAIKDRMRAIETHLIIQSLLLRDKRMVRHLFHRKNHVKQFDIVEEDDEILLPGDPEFTQSNSVATSPASVVQVAEEIEDTMDMEDDYDGVYTEEEEGKGKEELVCLYPFTKSCSATQRKIKQQYDQLVKSHGSNGLTLDQVFFFSIYTHFF